jgi:hypothetical protein
MRRLNLRQRPDRGAVAIIVAMSVGGAMFLLAIAALTVDLGTMSVERRQLQNGADAAAQSAVIECATTGTCPDVTNASDPKMLRLVSLANLNAGTDGATSISRIDGNYAVCGAGKPELRNCVIVRDNLLRDCPTVIPTPAQYVRVYTETQHAGGNTILPSGFAEAITGSSAGTRHQACAAYAWGTPASFTIVAPLTFSLCDYEAMITTDGYADPPPYANPIPASVSSHETAIVVNDPSQTTDSNGCKRWAGHILPGGFGYLDPDGGCSPSLRAGDWVMGKPGASVPNSCKSAFDSVFNLPVWNRQVMYIPVFDCVSDETKVCPMKAGGKFTYFHIKGLAAFYITGSNMPSYSTGPLTSTPRTACPGGKKCLFGWFTQATLKDTGGTIGPGTGYGVNIIKAVG